MRQSKPLPLHTIAKEDEEDDNGKENRNFFNPPNMETISKRGT